MNIDYAKQGVKRLISRRGRKVTYRRILPAAPVDPVADYVVGESRKVDTHGVLSLWLPFETTEVDGTRIQSKDAQVLIPAECLGFEPSEADELIRGGVHFGIVRVTGHEPGCEAYLYQLQVRPSPSLS